MKRTTFTMLLTTAVLTSQAEDYKYLTFEKTDGTQQSITAVGLTISYSNQTLTATNGTETLTLSVADLSRMFFSNDSATGISDLSTLEQDGDATVYSLSGQQVAQGRLSDVKALLRKGIYVVKQNGKSYKVQIR